MLIIPIKESIDIKNLLATLLNTINGESAQKPPLTRIDCRMTNASHEIAFVYKSCKKPAVLKAAAPHSRAVSHVRGRFKLAVCGNAVAMQ